MLNITTALIFKPINLVGKMNGQNGEFFFIDTLAEVEEIARMSHSELT